MPEKRRQNLAETERGSYYNQNECEREIADNKGAFYNDSENDDDGNNDENENENVEADVLQKRCPKNFAHFTEKHLYWSFFLKKLQSKKAWSFIKNRLQHRHFPMKFVNFLKTLFFTEHLW